MLINDVLPSELRRPTYRPGEAITTDDRHAIYAREQHGKIIVRIDAERQTLAQL